MAVVTQVLIGIIAALHIYFFLLETVLFKTRGRRVFGLTAEKAEIMAPAMSNQGCYNMFLAVALIIGLVHPDHDVSRVRWDARGHRRSVSSAGRASLC